jgi:hypothetical protein
MLLAQSVYKPKRLLRSKMEWKKIFPRHTNVTQQITKCHANSIIKTINSSLFHVNVPLMEKTLASAEAS